ncbi:hypothetical protein WR25_02642 [Diploscapter pachys]|uniref:Mos1 transposase HTH domain-containing protein n=1 Tax=Diploscapter pachys TaxID=2018661 RepID=A0A2A2KEU2_9BILA|nr:hypothetical protein WR25_02642 [Diploscapter pachys]
MLEEYLYFDNLPTMISESQLRTAIYYEWGQNNASRATANINNAFGESIAPSDYHLIRPLKLHLRGKKFDKYDDLKTAVDNFFASQPPEFWVKVIDLNCEYIIDS